MHNKKALNKVSQRMGMQTEKKYDVVVPVVKGDVKSFLKGVKWLLKYLPVKRIILVGNSEVKEAIPGEYTNIINYVNEDTVVSYDEVKKIIKEISDDNPECIKRTGWYLQQFIKMKYSCICEDDYYLVWDGDTYPIKKVSLFQDDHPIFDVKTEYHEAYFSTMHRVLPKLDKISPFSYISEHMLISCKVMKELISEIENSESIGNMGDSFYRKILLAIDRADLPYSGFSEFETYGTFCKVEYPDLYATRKWQSLRNASYYFCVDTFSDSEASWLNKYYDAVSFEKTTESSNELRRLYNSRILRAVFSFKTLQRIESGTRKIKRIFTKKDVSKPR